MNEFIILMSTLIPIISIAPWVKYRNDEVHVKVLEEAYASIERMEQAKHWFVAGELKIELHENTRKLKPRLLFKNHIKRVNRLEERFLLDLKTYD